MEICLQSLYLITLEVWKCGNMSSLSSSSNSGSKEMWKYGNMSSMSLSNNSGSVCDRVTRPIISLILINQEMLYFSLFCS